MATISKKSEADAERAAHVVELRTLVKPGNTVYCVLRHISASGMSRVIDLCVPYKQTGRPTGILNIGWRAAKVCGFTWDRDRYGAKVGGCGMDMGFHFVYTLSDALYGNGHPRGYQCIGDRCPSNSHSSGIHTPCTACDAGYVQQEGEDDQPCAACRGLGWHRNAAPRGKGVWHNDGYALNASWL